MREPVYPFISIILLNYNGRKYSKYWSSLFSLDYPKEKYEIVFIDNGSSDGSGEIFAKDAGRFTDLTVKMIKLEKNCGYSKANNLGVEAANGDYVALLSNDIRVSSDWLRNAIEILESDKQIGVAQSMMYKLDNTSKPDEMGNYIDVFGLNYSFHYSEKIKEVSYCEGAVMFIRRKILSETDGLFDEKYFMFYEDVDFSWRARLMGYKLVVIPHSIVYHKRGGTVSGILMKTKPLYVFCNTRNRLKTLYKNYSLLNMLKYLPFAIGIETMKGTMLAFSRKTDSAFACYKGILDFIFELPHDASLRASIQQKRVVDDSYVLKYILSAEDAIRHLFSSAVFLQDEWKKQ
jgi:hypothetical protein